MESAWPRTIAASRSFKRRGGSGNRALPPTRPGRSAAYDTSRSFLPEIARKQTPTARLNGSVGASFGVLLFGLTFDDTVARPLAQRDIDRRFRQLLSEATLIEFRHQRPLQF